MDAGPAVEDAAEPAVGDRVEVRATDHGTAALVHRVLAHVEGVVVDVDGDTLTVATPAGLRVRVDSSALDDAPEVGVEVRLAGDVSDDGETVLATGSLPAGPR